MHWKHQAIELWLLKEHMLSDHEGTEYFRNLVQHSYWILGIRNALRSIKAKCVNYRKEKAQTLQSPMSDLPEEQLSLHTFFNSVRIDYFRPFIVKIG